MIASDFYNAGVIKQLAINLFNGWGYNFYRQENQLRADDLMVRAKVSALLGAARSSVETVQSDYRREHLPPPTRAQPYPDPQAMANAQALERLSTALGALEGQIRALPVPENDRMTQRFRNEADTLVKLIRCDEQLVGQAEMLRATLADKTAEEILAEKDLGDEGLKALGETVRERRKLLQI